MKRRYRLGLDIGTNSIGWCVLDLDSEGRPVGIKRMGVRIFSDGRAPDQTSLAVARREARQLRRQRERTVLRRRRFLKQLIEYGLLPPDDSDRKQLVGIDPYEIRDRALRESVPIAHFGRALYHLARKRGFKSSRKSLGKQDRKEAGKISDGIARLHSLLVESGCQTVGQLLWQRHKVREPVLARPRKGSGLDFDYEYYPDRELILKEFDLLWEKQRQWAPDVLTHEAFKALRHTISFQRPLREVRPGYCLYEDGEPRVRRSHPLAARFRIVQDIANLRFEYSPVDIRPLVREQQKALYEHLLQQEHLSWSKIRSLLGVPKGVAFNLERAKKKGLKGDPESYHLRAPECFGDRWTEMRAEEQVGVVDALALSATTEDLEARLRQAGVHVSPEQLAALSKVQVSDEFSELSLKALRKIVPIMEQTFCTYDVAATAAGYATQYDLLPNEDELLPELPYYGKVLRRYTQPMPCAQVPDERLYGRIANPTVHVGLNELRKLINALIKRYGRPHEVVIELAREFGLSGKRRAELMREQQKNEADNERRRAELRARGIAINRDSLLRLRLWEQLPIMDKVCVYTGRPISQELLFSSEIEIDHIFPFSRSLDDGIGNLVLGYRAANRYKGSRDPYGAFGASPDGYNWDEIVSRVERFARESPEGWGRKARRFQSDALENFLKDRDFLARHLTDTAYLSRLARQYLAQICFKDRVWSATGKLTALLRAKWQLNEILGGGAKNRNDHRHHAIDAAVIGACDRRIIHSLSTAAARWESGQAQRMLEQVDWPFPKFSLEVRERVSRIIVSHRPDHGLGGALHNTTRYGYRDGPDEKGVYTVVRRVPVETLSERDLERIQDPVLASKLKSVLTPLGGSGNVRAALAEFMSTTGVRRLRVIERISARQLFNPHRAQSSLVRPDGNYCYEITVDSEGKWKGKAISLFDAARGYLQSETHGADGNRLVMRLRKNDTVVIEEEGRSRVMRVAQFSQGKIILAEHFEANADARHRSSAKLRKSGNVVDGFKFLQASESRLKQLRGRIAFVDLLGYVNDRGVNL
jgi:CRISPR-associated endonuclease Csn1